MSNDSFSIADDLAIALTALVKALPNNETLADYTGPLTLAEMALTRYRDETRSKRAQRIASELLDASNAHE